MAIANNEQQVQWSSSDSVSVSAGSNQTSDAITLSTACYDAMITMKADNAGTPASGDTVEIYALQSCGDPDGASATEYPADEDDGVLLAVLDTYANDPMIKTVGLPGGAPFIKIFAKSNASSNSITVSACINEKTSS
jgi:hypothetical protein